MTEIFIICGLILLNGIFSMSEVAMISARKSRLTTDANKGSKSAKKALDLANNPNRFLSTVQIGITLIGILTGIYSGSEIARQFTIMLEGIGLPEMYAHYVSQTLIVVAVTFLTIIFGELVPKRIGLSMAEQIAKFMSRPMDFLARMATPFVWLLSQSTNMFFDLMGIKEDEGKVTEEEIKTIVKEGEEDGTVEPVESDIVQRVFAMGNMRVGAIMTHKSDVVYLKSGMTLDEVREILKEDLFESYPVTEDDSDHVVGTIWLKDLVGCMHEHECKISDIMREPVYFHESMSIYKVLESMKQQKISRALICDEFGDFVGMITLKDIMEGLVGNIDEDGEEPDIVKCEDKEEWLVDGQCPLYDMLCYFEQSQLYEETTYHTLAGLILETLQHVPTIGEEMEWNGFVFKVVDMDGARINNVQVNLK